MRVLLPVLAIFLCATGFPAFAAEAESQDPERSGEVSRPKPSGHILNCMRPYGHHAYYREFTCPIGGETFVSIVLGTHSRYGRHLDWKPISYMDLAVPLPVCPSNGFVMFKDEFSEDEMGRYKAVIEGDDYQRIFGEKHASLYLLARLLELAGEENTDRWFQMLYATWEADGCKSEKYTLYTDETISAAKARMQSLKKSDQEYWILNIIIPNLYRRTGRFDEARKWLDGVDLEDMKSLEESRDYFELAFSLLDKAVAEKDTSPIPIRKPEEEGGD